MNTLVITYEDGTVATMTLSDTEVDSITDFIENDLGLPFDSIKA